MTKKSMIEFLQRMTDPGIEPKITRKKKPTKEVTADGEKRNRSKSDR